MSRKKTARKLPLRLHDVGRLAVRIYMYLTPRCANRARGRCEREMLPRPWVGRRCSDYVSLVGQLLARKAESYLILPNIDKSRRSTRRNFSKIPFRISFNTGTCYLIGLACPISTIFLPLHVQRPEQHTEVHCSGSLPVPIKCPAETFPEPNVLDIYGFYGAVFEQFRMNCYLLRCFVYGITDLTDACGFYAQCRAVNSVGYRETCRTRRMVGEVTMIISLDSSGGTFMSVLAFEGRRIPGRHLGIPAIFLLTSNQLRFYSCSTVNKEEHLDEGDFVEDSGL
ncbi:hypothetical protein DFH06DRAFT_211443 [Mycena polygramma]|nr:hypothetical protein DFH06DRAFT_211443 [Mycena polygramma]